MPDYLQTKAEPEKHSYRRHRRERHGRWPMLLWCSACRWCRLEVVGRISPSRLCRRSLLGKPVTVHLLKLRQLLGRKPAVVVAVQGDLRASAHGFQYGAGPPDPIEGQTDNV
jgi:hypothetical protein